MESWINLAERVTDCYRPFERARVNYSNLIVSKKIVSGFNFLAMLLNINYNYPNSNNNLNL